MMIMNTHIMVEIWKKCHCDGDVMLIAFHC